MRATPDHRREGRGRGPARVLAALGALLLVGAGLLHLARLDDRGVAGLPAGTGAVAAAVPGGRGPTTPALTPSAAASPGSDTAGQPNPHSHHRRAAGVPVRVEVPALNISAPVDPIAIESGVLEPPADFHRVGWWRDGAVAGAAYGTTVVTGHTVHTGGGVFNDLTDLHRGDQVRVTTGRGVLTYRVVSVTVYSKASLARYATQVFSPDVPGRLALVTCENWNGHGYDSNTVVLATPAPDR